MNVLHSPSAFENDDVVQADLIGGHASGQLVLCETGKFWPGVFLVPRDQVGMLFRSSAPKQKDPA